MDKYKLAAEHKFPDKDVTKEAVARLEEARAQKSLVEPDLREGYFFHTSSIGERSVITFTAE